MRYREYISGQICIILHIIFTGMVNILFPIFWVWYGSSIPFAHGLLKINPILSMMYLFQATILWMKFISYAHVNHDLWKNRYNNYIIILTMRTYPQ